MEEVFLAKMEMEQKRTKELQAIESSIIVQSLK